ncbi:MAPEG family protein [Azospirillum doebereinerae]|uniref:MAPEG family protein n=1 Tax=Azospirillum doebereinerae TaxID=92933 RepID=A0A433JF85_9PROT|nr:MAPEG family protein [Azospirillum doebereinerae]MCG5239001.1 MAPEG family protein [Azospirillum doebereinerae]RUQ75825.1 MAPEG family protein [Azospirillum doebereinerae]
MAGRDPSLMVRAAVVNLGAAAVTLLLFAFLVSVAAAPVGIADPGARMAFWGRLALWPALVLFAMAVGVMAARVPTQAFNPIDDPESRVQRVSQRVLANSVEQTLIFVPALAALVASLPLPDLGVPVVATGLFVLGRLLFWGGYLIHPFLRAPGMAMTLSVNLVVLGWAVLRAVA